MRVTRRTLFEGEMLQVDQVIARPPMKAVTDPERRDCNVLALPLSGVFAKHDGRRQHVIATPNHAVFIAADRPFYISYPAGVGDECLSIRFSAATLARNLPQAALRDGLNTSSFGAHALLPPALMVARSLLWSRLRYDRCDPLGAEEIGIMLIVGAFRVVCHEPYTWRAQTRRWGAWQRTRSGRAERVKEAVALNPQRKWTLPELADVACLSPWHLARVFRDEVGESVYRYVLRARLGKALDAVLDSGLDLTTIALDCGFSSHSHFTVRFREFFGSTPAALRRIARVATIAEMRKIVTAPPSLRS